MWTHHHERRNQAEKDGDPGLGDSMRRERIPIPKPRSAFLLVQCTNCGNEQPVFSATTKDMKCKVCQNPIAEKTGGKARILGAVLRRLV